MSERMMPQGKGFVPEDTSKRDPLVHLAGMWGGQGASEEYITGMEAAGQAQVVASSVLPISKGNQAEYEALGFTFGAPVDDLFQEATLPAGWTKRGSDHDMHSYVVDERGIDRVDVFYKAAFYDRSASMHILRPGYEAASDAIYGDGEVSGPWDKLTAEELADALLEAEAYVQRAAEHPDIYGKRMDRVAETMAQIKAAQAAS